MLLKQVMALLRQQGICTIIFLDDLLMMGQSMKELVSPVGETLQLLGFVINQEKSVLSPSHTFNSLAFSVESALVVMSLPQKEVTYIAKA